MAWGVELKLFWISFILVATALVGQASAAPLYFVEGEDKSVWFPNTTIKTDVFPLVDEGKLYFGVDGGLARANIDGTDFEMVRTVRSGVDAKRKNGSDGAGISGVATKGNELWVVQNSKVHVLDKDTLQTKEDVAVSGWRTADESSLLKAHYVNLKLQRDPFSETLWFVGWNNLIEIDPKSGKQTQHFEVLFENSKNKNKFQSTPVGFDPFRTWARISSRIDAIGGLYCKGKDSRVWKSMLPLLEKIGCPDASRVRFLWTERSLWCWKSYGRGTEECARLPLAEGDLQFDKIELYPCSADTAKVVLKDAGAKLDTYLGFNEEFYRDMKDGNGFAQTQDLKTTAGLLSPAILESAIYREWIQASNAEALPRMAIPLPPLSRGFVSETVTVEVGQVHFTGIGKLVGKSLLVFTEEGPILIDADHKAKAIPMPNCRNHHSRDYGRHPTNWRQVGSKIQFISRDEMEGEVYAAYEWDVRTSKTSCLPLTIADSDSKRTYTSKVVLADGREVVGVSVKPDPDWNRAHEKIVHLNNGMEARVGDDGLEVFKTMIESQ